MFKPIIRKALALLLPMLVSAAMFAATTNKVVTLNFSEDMFKINIENGVVQEIIYTKDVAPLPSDTTMPALPIVPFTVSAGPNIDCTFTPTIVSKKLILENVDVATAPQILPTSMIGKVTATTRGRYTGPLYPEQICTFNGKSEWSDVTYLHFSCSPFVYDSHSRKLYLIEQLDVDITATDRLSRAKLAAANGEEFVMTPKPSFISSPDFEITGLGYGGLDSLLKSYDRIDTATLDLDPIPMYIPKIDYLIITGERVKDAFMPLLAWKRAKGLNTKMVTVEDIYKNYSDVDDKPAQIKNYLRDLAKDYIIDFVFLGGDELIVPVRYCAGDTDKADTRFNTPADLYYACLNDPYDWDRNDNGIYGELTDSVSYATSFAVTRLPVNSKEAAEVYVNRVIEYECSPKWSNNLLISGSALDESNNQATKASFLGEKVCESIDGLWSGEIDEYYDDSDKNSLLIHPGEGETMKPEILQQYLQRGYNFVNIISHGSQQAFEFINLGTKYSLAQAYHLNNPSHTIFVAAGPCHTNAFDYFNDSQTNSDPCLSEALITSRQSGVIAYYGLSRYGYFSPENYLNSPAFIYDTKFLQTLFGDELTEKNFGAIAAESKFEAIRYGYANPSSNRKLYWIQYGLNPIGDPEMPIFTEEPKIFNGIQFEIDGRKITLSNDEPDCRISIRGFGSTPNYDRTYKNRSTPVTATNLPDQFTMCITKQNYIPWVYGFSRNIFGSYDMIELTYDNILKENFGISITKGQISIVVGVLGIPCAFTIYTDVIDSAKDAYLLVTDYVNGSSSSEKYVVNTGRSETAIKIPHASDDIDRFTIVTLIVDGQEVDSRKLR